MANRDMAIRKNEVVTSLFVDMADRDYILARISFNLGPSFTQQFFWLSSQAIEKYLKASLLLNGETSKGYRHDLVRLFKAVEQHAAGLFPEFLDKPEGIGDRYQWKKETPVGFLERISLYTHPDTRYNMYGHDSGWEDVAYMDLFVFYARRVAFDLSYTWCENPTVTVYDKLKKYPKDTLSLRKPLFELIEKLEDIGLYKLSMGSNLVFPTERYYSTSFKIISTTESSVWGRPGLFSDNAKGKELAKWAMDNIKISREVENHLRDKYSLPNPKEAPP